MSSGNNNKFYKQQTTPNSNASGAISQNHDTSDRMLWEMRNNNYRQQYYSQYTPSITPSILNSPILDDIIDQYQKVTGDSNNSDTNGLRVVLDSQTEGASNFYSSSDKDIVVFDDIDDSRGSWVNSQYGSRLVTGFSPTSSQSSHSGGNASGGSDCVSSKNRIIGDIYISDLQGSPRRFGSTLSNGQQSPLIDSLGMDKCEKSSQQRSGVLCSPINFPKRAPGFPKVSCFVHLFRFMLFVEISLCFIFSV